MDTNKHETFVLPIVLTLSLLGCTGAPVSKTRLHQATQPPDANADQSRGVSLFPRRGPWSRDLETLLSRGVLRGATEATNACVALLFSESESLQWTSYLVVSLHRNAIGREVLLKASEKLEANTKYIRDGGAATRLSHLFSLARITSDAETYLRLAIRHMDSEDGDVASSAMSTISDVHEYLRKEPPHAFRCKVPLPSAPQLGLQCKYIAPPGAKDAWATWLRSADKCAVRGAVQKMFSDQRVRGEELLKGRHARPEDTIPTQ